MEHTWQFWMGAIFTCIILGMIIGAFWGSVMIRIYPEAVHAGLFFFSVLGIVAMFAFAFYVNPDRAKDVILFSTTLLLSAVLAYTKLTKPIEETDRKWWSYEPAKNRVPLTH